MEKLEYVNVVPTISVHSDGVGKFVRNLHLAFLTSSIKSTIYSQDLKDKKIFESIKIFPGNAFSGRFKLSFKLLFHIRKKIEGNSRIIFHFHGLWMWVNFLPLLIQNIYYIYSPHGSISQHTTKNWGLTRRFIFKYFQLMVLNRALFVHATSNLEAQWLITAGVKKDLIKVIPLFDNKVNFTVLQSYLHQKNRNRFIFVGRIAPIKNLEIFLRAFKDISNKYKNAKLVVIGKLGSKYSSKLKSKFQCRSITFKGEKSSVEINKLMLKSNYLVLPSLSENFSYSALEACNAACKLVVSNQTPWNQLAPSFVESTFDPKDISSIRQALSIACAVDKIKFDSNELKKFSKEEFCETLNKEIKACNQTLWY